MKVITGDDLNAAKERGEEQKEAAEGQRNR